jgi:hypothetical protein
LISLARSPPHIQFFARQMSFRVVVDVVVPCSTSASAASVVRPIAVRPAALEPAAFNDDARTAAIVEAPKAEPTIEMLNDIDDALAWGINLPENLKLTA